ncbi:molybdate ABC transporter substrate-binding protein [Tabrizicola piscis]|uniref:Molybdate ABC transporter substrate-binding protein n=2 Tax=Tabrizicola piscis TaxID=2494374 RepID=A0A3S8UBP2_9RHOB|nr:molybdate ABC transporter substrate-binding protein [Tabrizicola piscis]AZL61016.1 molybdate ABC transporter substrate-binding protein [Tabrizicola piscis]
MEVSMLRAILLVLMMATPARAAEVTVFAAASLKTALDEIAAEWQADTGHSVVVSYGGSSALAKQIIEAAPADIFISASIEWMDAVAEAGLVRDGTRVDLLGNRLVLVAHGAGAAPVALDAGTDLAGMLAGGKLSMAMVTSVPAGQYGREALTALGLWDSVAGSVAQSENVRVALQLVALGEAPLGIVYASDAVAEPGVTVVATFPEGSHSPIIYPAAVLQTAVPEAEAFLDYLSGPDARAVFEAQGFLPLGAP